MSDRLDRLKTIRDQLTTALGEAEPAVMAQLAGQLSKVLEQIDAIESLVPEESESDDIKRGLAAGLAEAEVVQLAGRRRKPRAG